MIDVDLLSVIRRWHHREQLPIREIRRRTGLSRNTIRKYLADDIVEPKYPARKIASKLDPYAQVLASWLTRESKRNRKRRRNLKQLHRDLVALGFDGSYDRVAAFARDWRQRERERANQASRGAYVPLTFAPGEAFQFDWSEDWLIIGRKKVKLQIAHMKLCHSRAFVLRAYLTQTHEMLFDAHNHAFRVLGGVPERGIYDNMRTAVDKIGHGKQRVVNARFRAMVSHFLFEAEFCNPASGWEKGQVEKNVRDARHRLLHDAPAFATLAEANVWLQARCQSLWHEIAHPEQSHRTVADVHADEQAALMAMPPPFDGFIELAKRVSPTCLVVFERNRYSVPAAFANRIVSLRAYADRIVLVAEARGVAEHQRVFTRNHDSRGRTVYDWRHYLAVVQRKPGALRNGAPFTELPPSFKRLQSVLMQRDGGDREMADILALVLHHDERLVEQAVNEAIQSGIVSKTHILNRLSRLLDAPPPTALTPPPALTLREEPLANTERYDALRGARHVS
ncbi:MAG TPA: IS21 family transposase [Pseudomonadales bacterium]|nr:IS21 family transposase [Pseudomonadales bacterium]